jgi:hypothetical protein
VVREVKKMRRYIVGHPTRSVSLREIFTALEHIRRYDLSFDRLSSEGSVLSSREGYILISKTGDIRFSKEGKIFKQDSDSLPNVESDEHECDYLEFIRLLYHHHSMMISQDLDFEERVSPEHFSYGLRSVVQWLDFLSTPENVTREHIQKVVVSMGNIIAYSRLKKVPLTKWSSSDKESFLRSISESAKAERFATSVIKDFEEGHLTDPELKLRLAQFVFESGYEEEKPEGFERVGR